MNFTIGEMTSPGIFGIQKLLEIVQKFSHGLRHIFGGSLESGRKSSESHQKCCYQYFYVVGQNEIQVANNY